MARRRKQSGGGCCEYGFLKIGIIIAVLIGLIIFCMQYVRDKSVSVARRFTFAPEPEEYLPKLVPTFATSNKPGDVYLNPHAPPLNNPWTSQLGYNQVGYIKESDSGGILPLFAKEKNSKLDKWNYYTIQNGIKLQVFSDGRECLNEHGCNELMNNDTVKVENKDSSENYVVTVYGDQDGLPYQPFV